MATEWQKRMQRQRVRRRWLCAAGVLGFLTTAMFGAYWVTNLPAVKFNGHYTQMNYGDTGGVIFEYLAKYQQARVEGTPLRFEGICGSACTYFLNIVPPANVCAGPLATFAFHGVYGEGPMGLEFRRFETQYWHAIVYPPKVLKALAARGFDGTADVKDPTGFIWMDRDALDIQHCPE